MATPAVQDATNGHLLPGYRGSRATVLVELKRAQPATAKELATRLGISLTAVRHHLKELEAEGLVTFDRRHAGVGAPAFAYRLAPAGEALFPRRYEETLAEVLDRVSRRDGRAAAVALLEAHFDALRERVAETAQASGEATADRMNAVVRALTDAGYMAEGAATFCCGTLTARNCPIHSVAARFPELCAAEERFLAEVLGASVERRAHILAGCGSCDYHVRFGATDVGAHIEGAASPRIGSEGA